MFVPLRRSAPSSDRETSRSSQGNSARVRVLHRSFRRSAGST